MAMAILPPATEWFFAFPDPGREPAPPTSTLWYKDAADCDTPILRRLITWNILLQLFSSFKPQQNVTSTEKPSLTTLYKVVPSYSSLHCILFSSFLMFIRISSYGVPAVVQWVNDLASLCGGTSLILGPKQWVKKDLALPQLWGRL